MSEETKTDFPQEGDNNPFKAVEEEESNLPESSPEETETEETPAPEENNEQVEEETPEPEEKKPFNEDPRWKEREDDWTKRFNEQETRHTEEIQELREEFGGKPEETKPTAEAPSEIPAWFNGDQAQWNEFNAWNQKVAVGVRETIKKEMVDEKTAEQDKINDATKYMETEIAEIESNKELNPDGKKIDKNKLLKFTLDNELVDTKGRWNYKVAWRLMSNTKATPTETKSKKDRKDLAGATGTEHKADEKPPAFMTSEDFEKPGSKPW